MKKLLIILFLSSFCLAQEKISWMQINGQAKVNNIEQLRKELNNKQLTIKQLNAEEFNNNSSISKYAYAGSIILLLAHHSTIDAWIWEKGNNPVPKFIKQDLWYLGGTAVCVGLLTMASYKYDDSFWGYTKTSVGAMLLGSVVWDLIFGQLLYKDALYPYPNWYGGYGFKNKTQRIAFDVGRLTTGIILLLID